MTYSFSFSRLTLVVAAFLAMAVVLVAPTSAHADEPRLISSHNDWNAFTFMEDGKKVCFMATQPQKAQGKYSKRGEVFALVTHRPGDSSFDVVSFVAGYTFQKGSDVTVKVDGRKFTLFTQSDTAWTPDNATDRSLTEAIKNGVKMVVEGRSTRGTLTTDTYSLSGSTAAYNAISKACGK